jgi:hypothetical protein
VQWGVTGIVVLYAMWLLHLLLFRGDGLVAWIRLVIVVHNIFTSLFNSHISDFTEGWMYVLGVGIAGGMALVPLRHKFKRARRAVEARQHGHRGKRLTRAPMMRRRTVAIEFGTWRSGRNGGSSGSVTVGNGKLREPRGGTRS